MITIEVFRAYLHIWYVFCHNISSYSSSSCLTYLFANHNQQKNVSMNLKIRTLLDWFSWRREAAHWQHSRRSSLHYCRRWSRGQQRYNRHGKMIRNRCRNKILNKRILFRKEEWVKQFWILPTLKRIMAIVFANWFIDSKGKKIIANFRHTFCNIFCQDLWLLTIIIVFTFFTSKIGETSVKAI